MLRGFPRVSAAVSHFERLAQQALVDKLDAAVKYSDGHGEPQSVYVFDKNRGAQFSAGKQDTVAAVAAALPDIDCILQEEAAGKEAIGFVRCNVGVVDGEAEFEEAVEAVLQTFQQGGNSANTYPGFFSRIRRNAVDTYPSPFKRSSYRVCEKQHYRGGGGLFGNAFVADMFPTHGSLVWSMESNNRIAHNLLHWCFLHINEQLVKERHHVSSHKFSLQSALLGSGHGGSGQRGWLLGRPGGGPITAHFLSVHLDERGRPILGPSRSIWIWIETRRCSQRSTRTSRHLKSTVYIILPAVEIQVYVAVYTYM